MTVTIYDIARKANVSHSTVSRVLSRKDYGKRSDSIKRAKTILDIAAAEGYQPNNTARSLVGKQSHNICFLMSDNIQSGWANAYFAQLLDGVEAACQEYNYGLIINRFCGDDFNSFFIQRRLGGREFDGIVIAGEVSDEMQDKLNEHKLSFISINHTIHNLVITDREQKKLHSLIECTNNYEIFRYAYRKGHRKVGYIFSEHMMDSYGKLLKFQADAKLTDSNIISIFYKGNHNFDSGEAIMEKIFEIPFEERPSLISGSYQSCIALLRAMKAHGLSCPDDMSLISNCDSEACAVVEPGLTVICTDLKKRGYIAAMGLIVYFEQNITLKNECCGNIIIERQSVMDLSAAESDKAYLKKKNNL